MPRLLLILLCLLLLAAPPLQAQDAEACNAAFPAAESRWQIPKGLLSAIAQVESNRWPWIIDTAGTSHSFASKAEAEAAVASLTAQGLRNVDVGCMQISLLHHPDAFSSLSQAFDPATNIDYAARFLAGLHRLSGSWEAAIARYHSSTPGLGESLSSPGVGGLAWRRFGGQRGKRLYGREPFRPTHLAPPYRTARSHPPFDNHQSQRRSAALKCFFQGKMGRKSQISAFPRPQAPCSLLAYRTMWRLAFA